MTNSCLNGVTWYMPLHSVKALFVFLSVFLSLLIQCIIYTGNPPPPPQTWTQLKTFEAILVWFHSKATSECNPTNTIRFEVKHDSAGFWALRNSGSRYLCENKEKQIKPNSHTHTQTRMKTFQYFSWICSRMLQSSFTSFMAVKLAVTG